MTTSTATIRIPLLTALMTLLIFLAGSLYADEDNRDVTGFIGIWMGISQDDGSFFKVGITDNDGDGVAEVVMHDTFWGICTEANNLEGLEATLTPALVTGTGTVDENHDLNVDLTLQCRDELNQDLGGPLGPLPISFVSLSRNQLQLVTGTFAPSPLFRISAREKRGAQPGPRSVADLIGLWMGISKDDGSFFKVAITDTDSDGIAEVIMHDTFWSICSEANDLQGMEATLVPALATGPGTFDNGSLNVDLTLQCRDELNQDLGTAFGPFPIAFVAKSIHHLELMTGMFDSSPLFRVGISERPGHSSNHFQEDAHPASYETRPANLAKALTPKAHSLKQNFPNPFNPSTRIRYDLKEATHVTIEIYDMLGRLVNVLVDESQTAGYRSVVWNGQNQASEQVSSGNYLYKMTAGDYNEIHQMVLTR